MLDWVTIGLDEFEALRLVDGQGLDQEAAATALGVSKPTVCRILKAARGKIARALVEGLALRIEGGPVVAAHMPPDPMGRGDRLGGGRGRHGQGHCGGHGRGHGGPRRGPGRS